MVSASAPRRDNDDFSDTVIKVPVAYDEQKGFVRFSSKGSGSFIVEGCTNPDFGVRRLLDTIHTQNHDVFEIFVYTRDEIILERYANRAGVQSRHIAHGNEILRIDELRNHLKVVKYRPSKVAKYLVQIDTGECKVFSIQPVIQKLQEVAPDLLPAHNVL